MFVECNQHTYQDLLAFRSLLVRYLQQYDNLINSYLLEFFNDSLWETLPVCWRNYLVTMDAEQLSNLLVQTRAPQHSGVAPLSFLSFMACNRSFAFSRSSVNAQDLEAINRSIGCQRNFPDGEYFDQDVLESSVFRFIYSRHMKVKKKHEISKYSSMINAVLDSEVVHLIDFGSGQGHLARFLALHYGFEVTTLEADAHNCKQATSHDQQALKYFGKRSIDTSTLKVPNHLNLIFDKNNADQLPVHLSKHSAIIGLHSCGNLSADMLGLFLQSKAEYLFLCSCCYHKMDSDRCPLFLTDIESEIKITYEFKEIACHAQEAYVDRLMNEPDHLQIHCYRAMLEYMFAKHYPDLRRSELSKVRHFERLTFEQYVRQATRKFSVQIEDAAINDPEILDKLEQKMHVVIFYVLRILIAPVLETFIQLDRQLFLWNKNRVQSVLFPLFNPRISPRNGILLAKKTL